MNILPKKWFFFDATNKKLVNSFYNITNNIGIVFFSRRILNETKYFKLIKRYVKICHQKKIYFFVYKSIYWARKYNAKGVVLPVKLNNSSVNTRLQIKFKNHLLVSTIVHNLKEINLSKFINFDLIFLSPAFKTDSHKTWKPLNPVRFIYLCKLIKTKVYALGGTNETNVKLLKNRNLYGFGGISFIERKSNFQ